MKLFKKEIIKSIKLYLKNLSEVYEIDENDFYNLYLNKYLKRNKKTTAYMMFVKNMHKEYDQEKKEKINFVDKAKSIGTKWGNLTEQEKEVYKSQAHYNNTKLVSISSENIKEEQCIWISNKTKKRCIKIFVDMDCKLCKKHYKLNLKKKEYLEREQNDNLNELDSNYINSKLVEYIYESKVYYKDIYNRFYIINQNNIASCVGHIVIENDVEEIVFYNNKNKIEKNI